MIFSAKTYPIERNPTYLETEGEDPDYRKGVSYLGRLHAKKGPQDNKSQIGYYRGFSDNIFQVTQGVWERRWHRLKPETYNLQLGVIRVLAALQGPLFSDPSLGKSLETYARLSRYMQG